MDVTLISRFGSDCPHSDMRSCKMLPHKTTIEPVSLGEKTCCNCTAGLDFRVSLHARLVRSKGADGEMAVKRLMGRFTT